jgi:glutathione S-transferase
MTITLCGFPVSNYYNKVKLALLEKGVPFTEDVVMTKSADPAVLAASPLAKIPFIPHARGWPVRKPGHPGVHRGRYPIRRCCRPTRLPPPRCASSCTFIDLHLELVARDLYAQAFFGGTVSDSTRNVCASSWKRTSPAFAEAGEVLALCGR